MTHPVNSAEIKTWKSDASQTPTSVFMLQKTVRITRVEWIVRRGSAKRLTKVRSNLPTGERAAFEHNPSRCWRFHSKRRAWAAAADPSLWRRGSRSLDARRPLPWWWPDLQTCFFRLSSVKRRASSFASIRTSTQDPASSVHRSGTKISWKRRQGSRRRAGMCKRTTRWKWSSAYPPRYKKKYQTRETVVAAAQRWRRDPGGRKGGGVTSDTRSDLHPKPELHERLRCPNMKQQQITYFFNKFLQTCDSVAQHFWGANKGN